MLYGYEIFFIATALLGIPVLILVWLAGQAKFDRANIPCSGSKQKLINIILLEITPCNNVL